MMITKQRRDDEELEDFDEEVYLLLNSDVEAAVKAGTIASGLDHYLKYGMREKRQTRFIHVCSRRNKILAGLDLAAMNGMEIGALDKALITKSDGSIFYVDYCDTEALRAKYAADPSVNTSRLAEIDGIWGVNTLRQALGGRDLRDYVVASHVIEHSPDLITWLFEISEVLNPIGKLRLAVPDKRYSFDYFRPESGIEDILDAYLRKARAPLPRMILDHFINVQVVDVQAIWSGRLPSPKKSLARDAEFAIEVAQHALSTGAYHDTHCWVFTPQTFFRNMRELCDLGLLNFKCTAFFDTAKDEGEFFVHLEKSTSAEEMIQSWNYPTR